MAITHKKDMTKFRVSRFAFRVLNPKPETRNAKPARGQGALEYAALLAIVLAALLGMAVYMERSLCGRWRSVGDVFGSGRQYEPGVTRVTESD